MSGPEITDADSQDGPTRTCIGCRRRSPIEKLERIALVEGSIQYGRCLPGRGAWLCRAQLVGCAARAVEKHAFSRAFRTRVAGSIIEEFVVRTSGRASSRVLLPQVIGTD